MQNNFQVHISSGRVSLIKRNVPAVIVVAYTHPSHSSTLTCSSFFSSLCYSVCSRSGNPSLPRVYVYIYIYICLPELSYEHKHSLGQLFIKASIRIDFDLDYLSICSTMLNFNIRINRLVLVRNFSVWLNRAHASNILDNSSISNIKQIFEMIIS